MPPPDDSGELLGSLMDLSPEERALVKSTKTVPIHKCCTSPYWLYRIYQDTYVDLPQVTALIKDGIDEAQRKIIPHLKTDSWLRSGLLPAIIEEVRCVESPSRQPGELWITWRHPWNGAKVDEYVVLVENNLVYYVMDTNEFREKGFQKGEVIKIFIKSKVGHFEGEFGPANECTV